MVQRIGYRKLVARIRSIPDRASNVVWGPELIPVGTYNEDGEVVGLVVLLMLVDEGYIYFVRVDFLNISFGMVLMHISSSNRMGLCTFGISLAPGRVSLSLRYRVPGLTR